MQKSALFGAKKLRNFRCVVTDKEGLRQCRYFSDKAERVNFSRFCADAFMDEP